MSTPTQVRRPWRATARTIFAGIVAFAALLPFLVDASGLEPEVYPWLGGILAVAAAVTRIMALPQVEAFLTRFFPWLAADPDELPDQRGTIDAVSAALVAFLAVLILVVVVKLL